MKKIDTANLIKLLSNYDFYDWDLEHNNKYAMTLGISQCILESLNIPEYYDS